jgi:preprotein translocase YajC subunit
MLEFVLVFAVLALGLGAYWTMVVFPKQREFQHKQKVVRSLHVGDEVVTYGGIVGKIIDIDVDKGISYLEIADGVTIKLLTVALQHVYDPNEIAYNSQIGMQDEGEIQHEKVKYQPND